jgi:hypothetical protein
MRTSFCLVIAITVMLSPCLAGATWSHDPEVNNPVCIALDDQEIPRVVGDGEGGYIVVWQDLRSGADYDIYAQRIDPTGEALWAGPGVQVCGAAGDQMSPQLIADGASGYIVVWEDGRGADADIYAQRIDDTGGAHWTAGGFAVCAEVGDQDHFALVADGSGGVIVAWEDHRRTPGAEDLFAQRVDAGGSAAWTAGGVAIGDTAGVQKSVALAQDGFGGVVLAWSDGRPSVGGIHAARLDDLGDLVWPSGGNVFSGTATAYDAPVVLGDGAGGGIVACQALAAGGHWDILAQRLGGTGAVLWGTGGATLCSSAGDQTVPRVVTDGSGGAIVAWHDGRAGSNADIYVARVTSWGTLPWLPNGVGVTTTTDNAGAPRIVSDGGGGVVVTWHGGLSGYEDVLAQRIASTGTAAWTLNGVALFKAPGFQMEPDIASDGAGGAVVVCHDFRNSTDTDIYAQRIERHGYLGYPSPVITSVIDHPDDQGGQLIASWSPSYLDAWPYEGVDAYTVWRRFGGTTRGQRVVSFPWYLEPEVPATLERDGWALVGQIQAYQLPEYAYVVPSFGDVGDTITIWTDVMVLAHSYLPEGSWMSEPGTGCSIDNWAPGAPDLLVAVPVAADIELSWHPSRYRDEDLRRYQVHRSDAPGFSPGAVTLLSTTPDTLFTDLEPDPGLWYYRVIAEDVHGNESLPSNEASAPSGTGVDDVIPAAFALRGSFPNPFSSSTSVAFDLPAPCRVRLDVYTVDGRHVATVSDGLVEPGQRSITWNGRDDRGRPATSGIYFARLEASGEVAVQKVVLAK